MQNFRLNVSPQTIRNRLHEACLQSHVTARKPFISEINLEQRLKFAQEHENWKIHNWKKALFVDES